MWSCLIEFDVSIDVYALLLFLFLFSCYCCCCYYYFALPRQLWHWKQSIQSLETIDEQSHTVYNILLWSRLNKYLAYYTLKITQIPSSKWTIQKKKKQNKNVSNKCSAENTKWAKTKQKRRQIKKTHLLPHKWTNME